MKKFGVLAIVAVLLASLFTAAVSAQRAGEGNDAPVQLQRVWVDGDVVYDEEEDGFLTFNDGDPSDICRFDSTNFIVCETERIGDLERGQTIDVQVKLVAMEDVEDVEVELEIDGYRYSSKEDVRDEVRVGDVHEGESYKKTLTITLPQNLDNDDTYDLRLTISGKEGGEIQFNIPFRVNTPENQIDIERVLFSPGQTVEAGRSLFTQVRVDNFGQEDEDDVLVTFSIPELGLQDSAYIEEVEVDDEKISKELFVTLPVCAKGEYDAKVVVEYNKYDKTEDTYTINVLPSSRCAPASEEGKTVMTVSDATQNVVAGGPQAVYPLALTNAGKESKTYQLESVAGNGLSVTLSDSVVVLGAGETKVVTVMVSAAKDAPAGEHRATVLVKSGEKLLEQFTFKANVVKNSGLDGVRQGLYIGLIVLVVLLVILGLIIGFSRLKGDDDMESDEKDEKTYY